MKSCMLVPGRLYVVRLLSLVPLPPLQQLMLQSLWLVQALGHESASHGWLAESPMFSRPGLQNTQIDLVVKIKWYFIIMVKEERIKK